MQQVVYIGLGSNIGDRKANIDKAISALRTAPGIDCLRVSKIVETEPLGQVNQPKYLNAVAQLQTNLDAQNLLKKLLEIENALGRQRQEKWSPRTIDLDLLLYGDKAINKTELTVPHSQMHLRTFVLKGLLELNPGLIHPILNVPIKELAVRLNGKNFSLKPQLPQLISVAGLIGVGKTTLATKLSKWFDAELLLEPYDTNPFLQKVYAGEYDLALHSQLYFLFSRTEQLNPAKFEPAQGLFTDYIFEKDLIYARQLLDSEQLAIYEKIYPLCSKSIIKPVLVIYLRDSCKKCLDRIHYRNRPYEQKIDTQFLAKLDVAYEKLFAAWTGCPVIKVSKSEFDCACAEDMNYLMNQISAYIASSD